MKKHPIWSLWYNSEYEEVVKRKIEFDQIADVTLSNLQVCIIAVLF